MLKQTFEKCRNALMMLLCMDDECRECHMHADDYLDKTTNEVFSKRITSQFEQILSKICSDGVDVTVEEHELHALNFLKKAFYWQPC